MTAPYTAQGTTPRPYRTTASDEAAQLAQALYRAVLVAPPKRCALMTANGARKYSDAPLHHQFTVDDLRDHLAGRRTWATTLADTAGLAVAGCRDYDAGGEAVIVDALAAAHAARLSAFGIVLEGQAGEHSGGHVWTLYRAPAPAADIRAQLRALPGEKGELYPSGNCLRLPLGLHRRKGTRGSLLLQDGRRFRLDVPAELAAGLRVILALGRNPAPPPAPPEARQSNSQTFGACHNPVDWQHLPDGAALMAAPRYQALFRARPQLATLMHGARVVLRRDGVRDDSDSAQVAALVCNLLTSCHKGQQPGTGAPPLAEIRALALHWKPALRDKRPLAHYRAHVDYEIRRYTPPAYAPAPTQYVPGQRSAAPQPQQQAEYAGEGRPAGQRARQLQRLLALVDTLPADADGWRETTRAQLAAALGCGVDMVSKYMAELRGNSLETSQRQHGIALRLVINSAVQGCNARAEDRATTPESASAPCMESHSRPPDLMSARSSGTDTTSETDLTASTGLEEQPANEETTGGACVAPEPAPALQDIDISRARGSATEERMAAVYAAQRERVRRIPCAEQQRTKRGDLERALPNGCIRYTEVKGERAYPTCCAAIEFETVPLNAVAYGGPSGLAESRADTFCYVNTTSSTWWELEVATVRALLPQWRQRYRTVNGMVNERDTPHGHARYHTRCVLVPQAELARHAIASGIAPAAPTASQAVERWVTRVRQRAHNLPGGELWAERLVKRERALANPPSMPMSPEPAQQVLPLEETDDPVLLALLDGTTPIVEQLALDDAPTPQPGVPPHPDARAMIERLRQLKTAREANQRGEVITPGTWP